MNKEQHQCDKCNKIFKSKRNLQRHNNKNRSCVLKQTELNNELLCVDCGNIMSTKSSLKRHQKRCNLSANKTITVNRNEHEEILKNQKEMQARIKKLESENAKIINNNTTNNNTTNNITVNLTLNNYDTPNLDYIAPIIQTLIKERGTQAINGLTAVIWFNPEHPENHTVLQSNDKSEYLKIYKNEWISEPRKQVMDKMYDVAASSVNAYIKNPLEPIGKEEVRKDTQACLCYPPNIAITHKQMELDLINGKKMVKNTYKSTQNK